MILFLPALLIIHILILNQLTFTAWPEMLSYPYLLANNFSLYKDFIMPYPPGLVLLLSGVFQTFGFSVEVLKVLTWALILLEDVLVYLILKRVMGQMILMSLIFLGVFILLQSFLDGSMLWFDFAMVIPLLLAFWFGLGWLENFKLKNLFLVSLFLTMAIMIKQTAGIYLLGFGLFYLLIKGLREIKEIGVIAGGFTVLAIPLVLYLAVTGSLTAFWNWVVLYPLTEWSNFPGYVDFTLSKKELLVVGLLFLPVIVGFSRIKELIKDRIFMLCGIFFVVALISVYPRFSFFHLQPAIAFAVIIFARIFFNISQKMKILYLSGVVLSSVLIVGLLFRSEVGGGVRFYSKSDQGLAKEIINNIKGGEGVYLLGLNSSNYVFANQLPPKNWSDNFGWYLEISGVQEWVIRGFQENPPKKVFWRIPNKGNWYNLGTYQPQKITEFIRNNYVLTGNIEGGVEVWTRN